MVFCASLMHKVFGKYPCAVRSGRRAGTSGRRRRPLYHGLAAVFPPHCGLLFSESENELMLIKSSRRGIRRSGGSCMHLTLIINSVVCVVGTVVGLLFAGGSIISIANM